MKKYKFGLRIRQKDEESQVFMMVIYPPVEDVMHDDSKTNELIPQNYMRGLQISIDGKNIIDYKLSNNIAKYPFFSFSLSRPVFAGQNVQMKIMDNNGGEKTYEVVIRFDEAGKFEYWNYDRENRPNRNP